jgi:hypothetical protein
MLIMDGGHDGKPLDYAELERWTRVRGHEKVPTGGRVEVTAGGQ